MTRMNRVGWDRLRYNRLQITVLMPCYGMYTCTWIGYANDRLAGAKYVGGIIVSIYDSSLIDSKSIIAASIHRRQPVHLYLYVAPFMPLYSIWLAVYMHAYERFIGSEELTFLTLGSLVTVHMLTFLAAQWSVTARVWLTCIKVGRMRLIGSTRSTHAFIIPGVDHS